MNTVTTFFVKRSYASLAAGSFAIDAKHVQELIECECMIVHVDTGHRNAFALKNISLTPIDEHNVRVTFDPLTDAHAMPSSVMPKDLKGSIQVYGMYGEDLKDVPRFDVSNDASGNNPNLLSLDLESRQRFVQYFGGMCTLTDLCLSLHDKGIHVVDIHNNVKQHDHGVAVFTQRYRTSFELNKDNGIKRHNEDYPVLARMTVLM